MWISGGFLRPITGRGRQFKPHNLALKSPAGDNFSTVWGHQLELILNRSPYAALSSWAVCHAGLTLPACKPGGEVRPPDCGWLSMQLSSCFYVWREVASQSHLAAVLGTAQNHKFDVGTLYVWKLKMSFVINDEDNIHGSCQRKYLKYL